MVPSKARPGAAFIFMRYPQDIHTVDKNRTNILHLEHLDGPQNVFVPYPFIDDASFSRFSNNVASVGYSILLVLLGNVDKSWPHEHSSASFMCAIAADL